MRCSINVIRYSICAAIAYAWLTTATGADVAFATEKTDTIGAADQIATADDQPQLGRLLQLAKQAQRNDPRQSLAYAEQAAALADELDDEAARAQALAYVGIAHYYLGDYQRALRQYQQSLRIARRIGDREKVANAQNNIGILYYVWGEHDQALDHYFQALKIREEMNDAEGTAKGYNNLANVYQTAGEYEQALTYYQKSLELYEGIGDEQLVASSLNNIGLLHYDLEQYTESLQHYERALAIEREIDDKQGMALSLNNMGMVYDAWRRYRAALAHYREALTIREGLGDRQGVSVCLHNIGTVEVERGEHEQAIEYLTQALSIAEELDAQEIIRDNLLSLSRAQTATGDYEQALVFYQRYKAAHDDIFNEERSRQMAAAQARYEVDLKDREIEVLRKDQQIERFRRNVLLGGAALSLLIFLQLYNRYRFQKRAHGEIRRKNEAIEKAHAELERAAQDELAHVARVATMGEMAAAFAHELNQPLTAILTNASAGRNLLAVAAPDHDEIAATLADIAEGAERAREIIQRLRDLMRKGEIKRETLDLNETLLAVEALARAEARWHHAALTLELAPDLPPVEGDRIQLQQVLLNLVQNGAAATAVRSGDDRLLVVRSLRRDSNSVTVAVRDAGPPIGDEVFDDMFEPFFTTKPDGLGMGLPICRTIIEAHGGELWAERNRDGGMTVQFTLPVANSD